MGSEGLTSGQQRQKRAFDLVIGTLAFIGTLPLLVPAWIAARVSTGASGVFRQKRIGQHGVPFEVMKLRTMKPVDGTTVTVSGDVRITPAGRRLRQFKLDELPQLVNVLRGEMSLVGPRPDMQGFADELTGDDRIVLTVRPGITGPASLAFRHEEEILAGVDEPDAYNRTVIWPEKVRLNRAYVENWSLLEDVRWLVRTFFSVAERNGASR